MSRIKKLRKPKVGEVCCVAHPNVQSFALVTTKSFHDNSPDITYLSAAGAGNRNADADPELEIGDQCLILDIFEERTILPRAPKNYLLFKLLHLKSNSTFYYRATLILNSADTMYQKRAFQSFRYDFVPLSQFLNP